MVTFTGGGVRGGQNCTLGTFTGSQNPAHRPCYSAEVPFSLGEPCFQAPGSFHCLECSLPTACVCLANPSSPGIQCGATSSRKSSWIRRLDSGSQSPGLISTPGDSTPGGHCLSRLCLPFPGCEPLEAGAPTHCCLSQHLPRAQAWRRSTEQGQQRCGSGPLT